MKRYWLFKFAGYYPSGGMHDFVDSFDTIDETKAYIKQSQTDQRSIYGDYYQIADSMTGKVLYESNERLQ